LHRFTNKKGDGPLRWIGYIILVFMTLLLFVVTLLSSVSVDPLLTPFLFMIILGIVIESLKAIPLMVDSKDSMQIFLMTVISVLGGALATYIVSVYLELGAIVAAGLVGIIAASTVKKYAVEVYCGAFVGMVSPAVLHDFSHTFLAGLIAGVIYYLSRDTFKGYGGRLGTIAFASWIIMTLISNVQLLDTIHEWRTFGGSIVVYSFGAALITYILSLRLKNGTVMASSIVTLTGGLILPAVHGSSAGVLAGVVTAASFVGMSSKEKMNSEFEIAFSSIIMSIMFIYSANHFSGAGGKLGTLAFGSVVSARGILFLMKKAAHRRPQ